MESAVRRAPFEHRLLVRYAEVDSQQVVFNAHYLMYCDEASDGWFRRVGSETGPPDWEVMVKKAEVVWHSPARWRDELIIGVGVARWGSTSFDVRFHGAIEGRPVFDALLTYVAIGRDGGVKITVPREFRTAVEHLGHGPVERATSSS